MCGLVKSVFGAVGDIVGSVTQPLLEGIGLAPGSPDMGGLKDAMESAASSNSEIANASLAAVRAQAAQMEKVIDQMRKQTEASQKALEKQIADQEAAKAKEEAEAAETKKRRLRNMSQGRGSTILTGGSGLTDDPEVQRAKLLGGGA